jgi:hypothetical protein
MSKTELRNIREVLANEANGRAFPKLVQSSIVALERHGYIEKVGDTYKSTRAGRQAVLAAGKSQ